MSKLKIKTHLDSKFHRWLKTIDDETLRTDIQRGSIITGGAIVSMLLDEPVNDYDIYFKDYDLAYRVADYYVGKTQELYNTTHKVELRRVDADHCNEGDTIGRPFFFIKSLGIAKTESEPVEQYDEEDQSTASSGVLALTQKKPKKGQEDRERYVPLCFTENAITISDGIQLILRFAGDPVQVHKNFDFVHCHCYWQSWDKHLELPAAALESIVLRDLKYTGSLFPIASLFRMRKFIKRGWSINAGQILKIVMQCHKLDLNNVQVLSQQLISVDVSFMLELISKLEEQKKSGNIPEAEMNSYVIALIDEIFE